MPRSSCGSNIDLGLGQPVGMARARPAGLESVGREALRPPGPGKCASAASRTLIRGSSMLAWWLQWPRRALLPIAIGPPGQRLKVFTPRLLHSLAGRLARRRPTEGGRLLLGNLGHAYVGGSRKHRGFARRSAGSVRTASRRSIEAESLISRSGTHTLSIHRRTAVDGERCYAAHHDPRPPEGDSRQARCSPDRADRRPPGLAVPDQSRSCAHAHREE